MQSKIGKSRNTEIYSLHSSETCGLNHSRITPRINYKWFKWEESRFSCSPLEGVFLGAVTLLALGCLFRTPAEEKNYYHSSADCLMLCAQHDWIGWSKPKLIITVFKTISRMRLWKKKQTLTDSELRLLFILGEMIFHNSANTKYNKSACRVNIKSFSCFIFPCKK